MFPFFIFYIKLLKCDETLIFKLFIILNNTNNWKMLMLLFSNSFLILIFFAAVYSLHTSIRNYQFNHTEILLTTQTIFW